MKSETDNILFVKVQSRSETNENDFMLIDTEELVDLVSNPVQPEARSHLQLVITQETNNSKTEQQQLVHVKSFTICLEEQTMDENYVQMTVDDCLNIKIAKITF